METRRRPLRTYSKRTSTESTEPPLKRRCLTSSSTASVRDKETSLVPPDPEHTATALTLKPPTSLPSTKKGTITAYFGRIIPQPPLVTLSSVPSSDPSSQSNEPTIIPPSSPSLMTAKKRRARRLKTRVVTKRVHEKDDSDEDQENQDDKERMGRIRDIEPPENVRPPALLEATPNALNQGKGVDKARSSGGNPGENRRREKKTASVQTTLSLSMNEAQYTECKECGMLYNHLHKTDVKYHAQRHAALRRAKARTNAKSDVVE